MTLSRLRTLYAGEWLLVVLGMVALWLVASMSLPRFKPCAPAQTIRIAVDGAIWRIPTAVQPGIDPGDYRPKMRTGWDARSAKRNYCQATDAPPARQLAFFFDRRSLDILAASGRYPGLANLDIVWIGGYPRLSALPDHRRGEEYGPHLFGRPTVLRCSDIWVPAVKASKPLCRLKGWAPGGVVVELTYGDKDVDTSFHAVEALLTDLREQGGALPASMIP